MSSGDVYRCARALEPRKQPNEFCTNHTLARGSTELQNTTRPRSDCVCVQSTQSLVFSVVARSLRQLFQGEPKLGSDSPALSALPGALLLREELAQLPPAGNGFAFLPQYVAAGIAADAHWHC